MSSIRPAIAVDVPAMAAVHSASATKAYSNIFPDSAPAPTASDLIPSWDELTAEPASEVFVSTANEQVIGVVALRTESQTARSGATGSLFLARLYVHPDHWGQRYRQRTP